MKVVAFNGSPRKNGNTSVLIKHVLEELQRERIETELVQIGGQGLHGCIACFRCFENKNKRCAVEDDEVNECITKMLEADGIILASPTYFANVTAELKALIDRAGMVAKANDDMFRHKIGAAVVAVRRSGGNHVFNSINHFFLISQMVVPGSRYWNVGVGRDIGDVEGDEEGLEIMKTLGQNMAWLLNKVQS
jgi:multimeric flavodoxin WrbA